MRQAGDERATLELDSVGLHVLHNALTNIAAEMALVMMKTSYSTIFNEGLDFSTVLLDRDGNLIAEKNYTPVDDGRDPTHACAGRSRSSARTSSSPATSSSTTTPTAATATSPST